MDWLSKLLNMVLHLQVIVISVFSDEWKAEVEQNIEGLVSSCVVLPCKFDYPGPQLSESKIGGMWHYKNDKLKNKKKYIYHNDKLSIEDNFKDRTRLTGQLGAKNCTLEISELRDHDMGPFCFRAEIPDLNKYSFLEACVLISMKVDPDKPYMKHEEYFEEGKPLYFSCHARHTCPSHQPKFSWNRDVKDTKFYRDIGHGVWEVESVLTFTATEADDHTDITCTVTYYGGKKATTSRKLYIKRIAKLHHIIIPVVAVVGTAILFGGVCFFVNRRYRRQIQDLRARHASGVWSRISRVSRRFRGHETGRRSAPKPNNKIQTVSETAGFSKPRFPSPKSKQKNCSKSDGGCSADYDPDDYTNLADLNVYGNI